MGYICTRCGGTNVACEAIVNPNTGKIIDYFDGSFMHAICSNCENEVIISNIEEVKHEIDLRFHEFVERTGKEPEYVECQIVRKETGDEQRKTIKLSLSINDDDNDDVFCYCNGIDKMNVNKDMNGHNLIYVIKYGICRYAYRICIDSYPGYVVKDPITLIEWVQGLKPGTVIKIRGIFIYHFL